MAVAGLWFAAVRGMTAGRRARSALVAALAGGAVVVVIFLLPSAARASTSRFHFTGAEQKYVVPAGVTKLLVVAIGAPGGSGTSAEGTAGGAGGRGAQASAVLTVKPGQVLYVEVGGAGHPGTFSGKGSGGFNGGGAGGYTTTSAYGGGGGGASDVRTVRLSGGASSLHSRMIIAAGGGGGGGGNSSTTAAGGAGGNAGQAGAPTSSCGQSGTGPGTGPCGGGRATGTAGGAGGANYFCSTNDEFGEAGHPGVLGIGGAGASCAVGGGGGGGGLYGGGGGADGDYISSGGGGGGSSGFGASASSRSTRVAGTTVPAISITPRVIAPPNTTVTNELVSSAHHQAAFSFKGSGGSGALHFQCRLYGSSWKSCTSPTTYKNLAHGSYTFEVRAVDTRGKADPTPATRTFRI